MYMDNQINEDLEINTNIESHKTNDSIIAISSFSLNRQ